MPVMCFRCGKPITETGTDYKGRPVHIACYHALVAEDKSKMSWRERLVTWLGDTFFK